MSAGEAAETAGGAAGAAGAVEAAAPVPGEPTLGGRLGGAVCAGGPAAARVLAGAAAEGDAGAPGAGVGLAAAVRGGAGVEAAALGAGGTAAAVGGDGAGGVGRCAQPQRTASARGARLAGACRDMLREGAMRSRYHAATMRSLQDAYDELRCYTLELHDAAFVHQHVVDAFTAQNADAHTRPIALTFALVGLYLAVERQFSGRAVQRVHMELAKRRQVWPVLPLPAQRGHLTVADVLGAPPGAPRAAAIHDWCGCVWQSFQDCRQAVTQLLRERGIS
ncbi:MAG TPA: DUF5946 family protein [Steroidobacteraceae bacterium]|nr:DUF5946 family protein [Steroidobacteraceae bacterium]